MQICVVFGPIGKVRAIQVFVCNGREHNDLWSTLAVVFLSEHTVDGIGKIFLKTR